MYSKGWTSFLTGTSLGMYFGELSMWFTFAGIVIAVLNGFSEKETVDAFIFGVQDMISVVLIIALSRGVSELMKVTFLDKYILNMASIGLWISKRYVYTPLSYLLYLLSFFIPSTSGLAISSMPILWDSLTQKFRFSVEGIIMVFFVRFRIN